MACRHCLIQPDTVVLKLTEECTHSLYPPCRKGPGYLGFLEVGDKGGGFENFQDSGGVQVLRAPKFSRGGLAFGKKIACGGHSGEWIFKNFACGGLITQLKSTNFWKFCMCLALIIFITQLIYSILLQVRKYYSRQVRW